MAAERVTVMVLKVNLQCPCCYKKVKKILCKFPQIRDQVYDEKANTVRITVVCCSPEKIRDKLCCKGAKVIERIEIEPEKPKEKPPPPPPEKPKETPPPPPPEKPKEKPPPPPPEKPKEKPPPPPPEKPKEKPPPPEPAPTPPPPQPLPPDPVTGCPPAFPRRTCCWQCYEGYGGGPCYHGCGVPPPPPPCYDGYYCYGYGHVSRCDYYFSEENPQSCSIM